MWTRSGYFKPFYDDGVMGGTDMVYYIEVPDQDSGMNLANNLNLLLPQYIMKTAKWSGFGNEKVFARLPSMPFTRMSDEDMFGFFKLNKKEVKYVSEYMA
jgi:hypothetical protein